MSRWPGTTAVAICAVALTSCCSGVGIDVGGAENCNSNPAVAYEWISPDGRNKAVEARFVCPGWYAGEVRIVDAKATKSTAFTFRPVDQVRPEVWPELKVEWKSVRELWITYPGRQDTTCISSAGGVEVHCLDSAVRR